MKNTTMTLLTLLVLFGSQWGGFAAAGEEGERASRPPLPNLKLKVKVNGQEAIDALGGNLGAVAAHHGLTGQNLKKLLLQDKDLWLDLAGRLHYRCNSMAVHAHAPAGAAALARAASEPPAAAVPVATPPVFHSKPGATKIIHLDFNGRIVSGTAWNGSVPSYDCYPWSVDADYTTFSDAEQLAIKRTWQRIAEDYAPFNVDVTTEEPTSGTVGVILFTRNTDRNGVSTPAAGYGGIAYVGVFGNPYYSPAWVSTDGTQNQEQYMAAAGSHEMGHNLSLSHDGKTDGTTYYNGHGSGDLSWGPIMGSGYYSNVTQFSKGEYYLANQTQDDLALIAGYLSYRADDHGNTNATATSLAVIGGTTISSTTPDSDPNNTDPTNKGIIQTSTDVDVFRFVTAAGNISLTAKPWISPSSLRGGNLDVRLELYNSSGTLVAAADPPTTTYATLNATVALGTYYLHVKPVGAGTPLANPPSGYTVYGSLGQYFISGTVLNTGAQPDMSVQGLGQTILDGDATPSATDDTDFGFQLVNASHDHIFTILNSGGAVLNLTGTPKVALGGANPGDFSVAVQPVATVASGGSTTFTVRFRPTASGLRTATLSIANDDSDSSPYNFAIQGSAQQAPVIESAAWADNSTVLLPAGTSVHVVASDPDGDPLTYNWAELSGPGIVTFATPQSPDSGVAFSAAGTYVLRVVVSDGRGGSVSSDVTVSVVDPSVLAAPSGLTATASGRTVTLRWTDNSGNETGFYVERAHKIKNTYTYSRVATLGANATSFIQTGVAKGSYRYRVQAFDTTTGRTSAYSNEAAVTVR